MMRFVSCVFPMVVCCQHCPRLAGEFVSSLLAPLQVFPFLFLRYLSLSGASLAFVRARQSIKTANSQLGWNMNAQLGLERGVGMLGSATDIISAGAGATKLLESGSSISVEGGVRREDAENLLAPTIPNPATSSSVNLSLRQPLAQNNSQTSYQESKVLAELEVA